MSIKQILHVRIVANAGGGPEKTILRSNRYLATDKFSIHAAYIHPVGLKDIKQIKSQAASHGLNIHTIAERGAFDPVTIFKLVRLCKRLKIDVWHSHDYKSDILGIIVKRFYKMKLLTTVHGFTCENLKTRCYAWLNKQAFKGFDHLISVSPKLKQTCLEQGIEESRVSYIPNGIDALDYRSANMKLADLSSKNKRFNIGIIGRFSKEKGVERALYMLASMRDKMPNVHLHLVGDGPERVHLKELAHHLDLTSHITWWGWQDNPTSFYHDFDLFLLPSYTEGFPNVLLEAMICKTLIAATDVGGVADMLDENRCGILLENNTSPEKWADIITNIVNCPTKSKQLVDAAYERVMQNYTFCQRTKRVQRIYEHLTAA